MQHVACSTKKKPKQAKYGIVDMIMRRIQAISVDFPKTYVGRLAVDALENPKVPSRFFDVLLRMHDDGLFGTNGDRNSFFALVVGLASVSAAFCLTGVRAFCEVA